MDPDEIAAFQRHTGRPTRPNSQAREAWLVVGRRGGKSRIAALVAVFLATFRDYSSVLAPGERGVVMLLAQDRQQARVLLRYVNGLLDGSPLIAGMVEERLKERIVLTNNVDIEIHTSSFRSVRGYTIVGAVLDEVAYWRDESTANPDTEIVNAVRPGMATVPNALLLAISSPYARRGALWQTYKDHFGKDGDPVLVWQADTCSMNPMIPRDVVEDAYERDAAAAAAEWGAEFRRDIESFVSREALEAVTVPGRQLLPSAHEIRYFGFVDPSGGSQDSFTLAIAHRTKDATVLDAVLERRPPFSPESVVQEFVSALKEYRVTSVVGDRYGGEFPRELFAKSGVTYKPSDRSKSEFYGELLPLINSGKIELLDDKRLLSQLGSLERRTSRAGKDSIDHGPGAHDDLANAAAGALVIAAKTGLRHGSIVSRWEPRRGNAELDRAYDPGIPDWRHGTW